MLIVDAISAPNDAIRSACQLLRSGEAVAIPTETVYGLAGDIHNERSIRRLYEIKGRPSSNPLICHVSSIEMAQQYVHFDKMALALATAFWPGPLTLVLRRKITGAAFELASASLPTLAVRVPRGFSRELIDSFGRGLAAPSANLSGKVSPTCAEHVRTGLGDRVALIVDGGPCGVGVESTVIEVSDGACSLLRPGGLETSVIERVAGVTLGTPSTDMVLKSPGMMASHYAPMAQVRLNVSEVKSGEAFIAFGPCTVTGVENASTIINLSESGDMREAASRLFDALLRADRTGSGTIAVAPIPFKGLGLAINDRLRRAAAPRYI